MAQEDFIFPIPATKRIEYLEQNIKATRIALSGTELKQIENAFPKNAADGLRYTEAGMKTLKI